MQRNLHIKHWSTQQSKLRKFEKIFYDTSNFLFTAIIKTGCKILTRSNADIFVFQTRMLMT